MLDGIATLGVVCLLSGMSRARKRTDNIVVNPLTNTILTTLLAAEVFGVLYTLASSYDLPPSCPWTGPVAAAAQVVYCICLFGVIFLIKRASAAVGGLLSRHLFVDDPLSKPKTMHKFQDQMWQLAIHVRHCRTALAIGSSSSILSAPSI